MLTKQSGDGSAWVGVLASGVLVSVIAAYEARRRRLDSTDVAIFVGAWLIAIAVGLTGFGALGSVLASIVAVLGALRWRQRGGGSRKNKQLVQAKRLLPLLAIGIGGLVFVFGAFGAILLSSWARADVELWIFPLGLISLGVTGASWGVWFLRRSDRRPARKRRRRPKARKKSVELP